MIKIGLESLLTSKTLINFILKNQEAKMKFRKITKTNIETFSKLMEIFKGKNPTSHTVSIFRLLISDI